VVPWSAPRTEWRAREQAPRVRRLGATRPLHAERPHDVATVSQDP